MISKDYIQIAISKEIVGRHSHPSWATLQYLNIQALTDEEVDMFMSEADINGDGKLDYDEFVKIMLSY